VKRQLAGVSILMLFLLSLPVYADVPLDTVQANVNKVLEVLRDPKLKSDSAKEIKIEKLQSIYKVMFNQTELSRRALARNWSRLNPDQQQEFIQLFEQVLEKAYINKILSYTNEKIVFYKDRYLGKPGGGSDENHHLLKGNSYLLQGNHE